MKHYCLRFHFTKLFYKLGNAVGCHPYYFILVPFVTSLVLGTGLLKLTEVTDLEYLYVPTTGRALRERIAVETLFPNDKENVDFLRMTRASASAAVIIEAKDGGSMLRDIVMEKTAYVEDFIKNISITWKTVDYRYENLCLNSSQGGCFKNAVLELMDNMETSRKRGSCVKYPINIEEGALFATAYAIWLGDVITDVNNCIEDVKAFRLLYFLRDTNVEEKQMAKAWEKAFLEAISKINIEEVYVYRAVSFTVEKEVAKNTEMMIPVASVAFPLMLIFAVFTCFTRDCVTSKPWVGVAAVMSSTVAILGSFGILIYCGADFAGLNVTIPLLLLGIGLDDCFVLLAAWRRTDPNDSVEKRMSETYSEGAVSITITSITNLLSFCIGLIAPYRLLTSFFIYGSVSILATYISEITFFGGVLALSGYREKKQLHALLFTPVKSNDGNQKCCFCKVKSSVVYKGSTGEREELITFYRDKLGVVLTKPLTKFLVIITFSAVLAGGIYSFRYLKEGLDFTDAYDYSSYATNYTEKEYKYFSQYPHAIQVVINQTLDYSDPLVRNDVEEILRNFSTSYKMAGPELTDSWLSAYMLSTSDFMMWLSYMGYNISDKSDFVGAMGSVFLNLPPFQHYRKDVVLNENRTEITASRFIVMSKNISNNYEETDFIVALWKIADSCKYPVYVHNYRFVIQSLSVETKITCIITLICATTLVVIVFFVFVPNLLCTVLIGLMVASIQISVIGYMALWGVAIDIISSTCLIICTGLSIDYLAHVSYSYIVCESKNPNEKLSTALHAAGHPVFQGCFSTILLVASFPIGRSYVFIIFFKVMLLLMVFAGVNAMFVLPVFLTLCDAFVSAVCKDGNKDTVEIAKQEAANLINGRTIQKEKIVSYVSSF